MQAYRRSLQDPSRYHGHNRQRNFFEGWYFKLVDPSGQHRYALIPGIFKHQNPADSHAFIQVLNGLTGQAAYLRYPVDQFWADTESFSVRIGENHFQADRLDLNLGEGDFHLRGQLGLCDLRPWPVRRGSIGAMGWFGYLPFLECNHGVVSMDHRLEGALEIGGQAVDFTGGRGYTEKDWGSSFPSGYVWLQCNHFSGPGTSLMSSIAMIPRLGLPFRGFICGLYHQGQLYRFATYTGAKLHKLRLTDTEVSWAYSGMAGEGPTRGHYRLEITAQRSTGGLLKAPYAGEMRERVMESLTAKVRARLLKNQTPLWEDEGQYAGLEVAGQLGPLLDENLTQG
jgi:hypothetical protein